MTKLLPRIVYQMCVHGGLIVGSQAKKLIGEHIKETHDWDILVPLENQQTVAMLIPQDAKPNKFGGWRFTSDGNEIDVWPDDLKNYLTNCKSTKGGKVVAIDFIHNRAFYSQFVNIQRKDLTFPAKQLGIIYFYYDTHNSTPKGRPKCPCGLQVKM